MKRLAACLFSAATILWAPMSAQAYPKAKEATNRHCKARLFLRILGEEGQGTLFQFHPSIEDIDVPLRFVGGAYCRGRGKNKCRRIARNRILSCVRAQAQNLPTTGNIDACGRSYGAVGSDRWVEDYHDYRLRADNMADYLNVYACTAPNNWYDRITPRRRHAATIRYELYVKIWGDKGCGPKNEKQMTELLGTYTVQCPRLRNARSDKMWQGRYFKRYYPSDGYKRITSPVPSRRSCWQACLADERCKAWTFFRPPLRDYPRDIEQRECRLYDRSFPGTPINHSCCDSGAK